MAVQFILFNFADYSPSIAMELKVSKEITSKWNKYVSWAQLFEGRLVLNPGLNLTRVSFVQKHFHG